MPILEGSSYASFVVRLSQALDEALPIEWSTEALTAVPGKDYEETGGVITIAPGDTEHTVQVLVYGRAPGDTEARQFRVRVFPAPNAVLGEMLGNCVINVVDEDDGVVSRVTVATGADGLTPYELALQQGFVGTTQEWLESLHGRDGVDGEPGPKGDPGDQGLPGRDIGEMAFPPVTYTAVAGQTVFPIGFVVDPATTVLTMMGLELELGEDYYYGDDDSFVLTQATVGTEELVLRGFLPASAAIENYTAQMFGAVGDGSTSDADACQRLLDYLSTNKNGGEWVATSPSDIYVIDKPLIWRSQSPLKIRGTAPVGIVISYEGMAGFKYTGPVGSEMFVLETSGASVAYPTRGIEIENILIYRETVEAKGSGGAGIALRGVTRGSLKNVVVWGFDVGIRIDDNPESAGSNSVRSAHILMQSVAVYMAATYRLELKGAAEIFVFGCNFQSTMVPSYTADCYIGSGSNGGRLDAVHFYSCVFIGGTNFLSQMPDFNVLVEDGLWLTFTSCNFERSKVAGVRITYSDVYRELSTGSGDIGHCAMRDCWFDAHQAYAIDIYGARTHISNARIHQIDPQWNGQANTVTVPPVRIRGGPGTTIPALGSVIEGGLFVYEGPCGIDINNAAKVAVNYPYLIDKAAARAAAGGSPSAAKPGIKLGALTTSCVVMYPGGSGFEAETLDNGLLNTVHSHYAGEVYDRGFATHEVYLDGAADAAGNLLKPHGVSDAPDRILPNPAAAYLTAGGAWTAMTFNFFDGTSISVSGGAGAANRPVRIYFCLKRGNALPEL